MASWFKEEFSERNWSAARSCLQWQIAHNGLFRVKTLLFVYETNLHANQSSMVMKDVYCKVMNATMVCLPKYMPFTWSPNQQVELKGVRNFRIRSAIVTEAVWHSFHVQFFLHCQSSCIQGIVWKYVCNGLWTFSGILVIVLDHLNSVAYLSQLQSLSVFHSFNHPVSVKKQYDCQCSLRAAKK